MAEVNRTTPLAAVTLEGVPEAVATALNGTSVMWDRLPDLIRDALADVADKLVRVAEGTAEPSSVEVGELAVRLARLADALEAVA